jgi:hypothetical protein
MYASDAKADELGPAEPEHAADVDEHPVFGRHRSREIVEFLGFERAMA